MFLICVISLLSRYTLQINKPLILNDQSVKNTEVTNINTPQKVTIKKNIPISKKVNLWSDKIENQDINNQENILQTKDTQEDFSNEELYEEINFHDDFDEEYRNDVDSSYTD